MSKIKDTSNYWTFILCSVFFVLNCLSIQDGHNWGGDFSQYIIHAQNILGAMPYASGIMLDPPIIYPPGYPLIIAAIIQLSSGIDFSLLKFVNVLCWYLSLLALYPVMKRRLGVEGARWCSLICASSIYLFLFKQNVLSDLPFVLFVSIVLCLWDRYEVRKETDKYQTSLLVLILAFTSLAMVIRSAGLILFIASILYLIFKRREYTRAGLAFGVLIILSVALSIFVSSKAGFLSKFVKSPIDVVSSVIQNAYVVWASILYHFLPSNVGGFENAINYYLPLVKVLTPVLYMLLLYCFIKRVRSSDWSFVDLFLLMYVAMLLLWTTFHDPVRLFARFVWPIIIPIMIIIVSGLKKCGKSYFVGGCLAIVIFNFFCIASIHKYDDDVLSKSENVELFKWVKENLDNEDRYMFNYPRVLSLMTKRQGTSMWALLMDKPLMVKEWPDKIRALDINFLIFSKKNDQMALRIFLWDKSLMKLIWQNEEFYIFRVNQ